MVHLFSICRTRKGKASSFHAGSTMRTDRLRFRVPGKDVIRRIGLTEHRSIRNADQERFVRKGVSDGYAGMIG